MFGDTIEEWAWAESSSAKEKRIPTEEFVGPKMPGWFDPYKKRDGVSGLWLVGTMLGSSEQNIRLAAAYYKKDFSAIKKGIDLFNSLHEDFVNTNYDRLNTEETQFMLDLCIAARFAIYGYEEICSLWAVKKGLEFEDMTYFIDLLFSKGKPAGVSWYHGMPEHIKHNIQGLRIKVNGWDDLNQLYRMLGLKRHDDWKVEMTRFAEKLVEKGIIIEPPVFKGFKTLPVYVENKQQIKKMGIYSFFRSLKKKYGVDFMPK